jgi:hypothetical protein
MKFNARVLTVNRGNWGQYRPLRSFSTDHAASEYAARRAARRLGHQAISEIASWVGQQSFTTGRLKPIL